MRSLNLHVAPSADAQRVEDVVKETRAAVESLVAEGAEFDVLVLPAGWVPLSSAAAQLGFSRQHARKLIDGGLLEGRQKEGSSYWEVSQRSIRETLEKRQDAWSTADHHDGELDALGIPFE